MRDNLKIDHINEKKKRHLTAEFKARVATEALKKEKTIQQIAQDNDIAPTQVSSWKKELEEQMCEIFVRKNTSDKQLKHHEKRANSWGPISPKDYDRYSTP